MPFIISKVNVSISFEQEIKIKKLLGGAIELIPGKNENYLMVGFEQNYNFYLRGENQPCAFIEISIFGTENHIGYNKLTAAITKIFNDVLEISAQNIYIKYEDITAWSVNGDFIKLKKLKNLWTR